MAAQSAPLRPQTLPPELAPELEKLLEAMARMLADWLEREMPKAPQERSA